MHSAMVCCALNLLLGAAEWQSIPTSYRDPTAEDGALGFLLPDFYAVVTKSAVPAVLSAS